MQEAIKTYTQQLRRAMQESTSIDYPDSIWALRYGSLFTDTGGERKQPY